MVNVQLFTLPENKKKDVIFEHTERFSSLCFSILGGEGEGWGLLNTPTCFTPKNQFPTLHMFQAQKFVTVI